MERSTSATIAAVNELATLKDSWVLSLESQNKSPKTVETYTESFDHFAAFLSSRGMPTRVDSIAREHVEAFIAQLLKDGRAPATAANRYRALRQFFHWAEEDGEITSSPMQKMRPPKVEEQPPPVYTEDELNRLLATCPATSGSFDDKRDRAILFTLIDTGARRSEIANLKYLPDDPQENDVDLKSGTLFVMGKGARARAVWIDRDAKQALDRYIRARGKHRDSHSPWLWLSRKGRLSDSGILQMIRRRAKAAGIAGAFTHRFRHTFAHQYLAAGGNEGDLMIAAGWKSRDMLSRYGASAAAVRAREAHRRLSPANRLGESRRGTR